MKIIDCSCAAPQLQLSLPQAIKDLAKQCIFFWTRFLPRYGVNAGGNKI
jgi:hypothetical protein